METKIEFNLKEKEELLVLSNTYEEKYNYNNRELSREIRDIRNYYLPNTSIEELMNRIILWIEDSDKTPQEMPDTITELMSYETCESPLREVMESAREWLMDMYILQDGIRRYEWEKTREDY